MARDSQLASTVRLYKYRAVTERSLRMLCQNRLYFSCAPQFNDPFDCAIRPECLIPTGDQLIHWVQQQYKRFGSSFNELDEADVCASLSSPADSEHLQALLVEEVRKIVEQETGILSLSATPSHPLLWAHYALNHQGFCIEYERSSENFLGRARPVIYTENYPRLNALSDDLVDMAEEIMFTKAAYWSYEQEWRFLGEPNAEFQHRPKLVTGIILGARMSVEHKFAMHLLVSDRPWIRLYQAALRNGSFELDIVAVPRRLDMPPGESFESIVRRLARSGTADGLGVADGVP